jgi:ubiquinone/menaquinone biosynthesis C-methylase UbiE
MKKNWLEIWNKKSKIAKNNDIQSHIKANGFDSPSGKFTKNIFLNYVRTIKKKIKPKKNDLILEVGCGVGAFLYLFKENGSKLFGIDYSNNQIKKAKKLLPKCNFKTGEATQIGIFKKNFDIILSHSVFQYFNDFNYTKKVILKMLLHLKEGGKICILDVPDADKKKMFIKSLIKEIGIHEYKKKYLTTSHLYYKKSFFINLLKNKDLRLKIVNQNIKNYKNSKYRFNIFIKKI